MEDGGRGGLEIVAVKRDLGVVSEWGAGRRAGQPAWVDDPHEHGVACEVDFVWEGTLAEESPSISVFAFQ